MTSSVYNTAAETVLNAVVNGQALPKDANALADLILDEALESAAMDVALRGPSARVAHEYQAWRAGRATPVVPGKAAGSRAPPARRPGREEAGDEDTADPRAMPEDVARRMLHEAGGWERLHSELRTGTGLGQGLMPAERQALIDPVRGHPGADRPRCREHVRGPVLDRRHRRRSRRSRCAFSATAAPNTWAEAKAFLDTKHPAGRRRPASRCSRPRRRSHGRLEELRQALEKATPEARLQAARLAPLYEDWRGQSAMKRLEMLVGVVNEHPAQLGRAGGLPGHRQES